MRNLGAFFALAMAQDTRHLAETEDAGLREVAPRSYRPAHPSWAAKTADRLPASMRLEFLTAYHWYGASEGIGNLIIGSFERDDVSRFQQLEDRASLMLNGVQTGPLDAPCRGFSWSVVGNAARSDVWTKARSAEAFYWAAERYLHKYAAGLLADRRPELPSEPAWVPLTPGQIAGLCWVLDDATEPPLEERARAALGELMKAPRGMSIDQVAAWADVCNRYVMTRRYA